MPKSVIQSNWYYGEAFDTNQTYVKAYLDLEAEGYDQIPTGSYHAVPSQDFKALNPKNIGNTVEFCSKHISDSRLMGFMQTFWMPTTVQFEPTILKAIDLTGEAKRAFEKK